MVFSNQASVSMEDCAAAMGDAPRWFQLYWSTSDELVESLVGRAEAAGCDALVVTLDTTMLGWRPRDLDLGHLPFALGKGIAQYTSDPVFRRLVEERAAAAAAGPPSRSRARPPPRCGRWSAWRRPGPARSATTCAHRSPGPPSRRSSASTRGPSITWADLAWLRSKTRLPILLKGVLHPDDARRALDEGVDGVVVSTHGGRQVDRSIAALDALPEVVGAVAGRAPVLLDSGVRSGRGRVHRRRPGRHAPCCWAGRSRGGWRWPARTASGRSSPTSSAEFDLTLGLTGHTAVDQLSPGRPPPRRLTGSCPLENSPGQDGDGKFVPRDTPSSG